jgi:outer membrane protein assembly factor BamB
MRCPHVFVLPLLAGCGGVIGTASGTTTEPDAGSIPPTPDAATSATGKEAGMPPSRLPCALNDGLEADAPWPMLGRCPDHAARSPAVGPHVPHRKWAVQGGSVGFGGSPVITRRDTVLVPLGDELAAFDGATGALRWTATVDSLGMFAPAIGSDGTVYVGGCYQLYAFDAETGASRWTIDAPGSEDTSVALWASDLYASVGAGLRVLDRSTGSTAWSFPVPYDAGGAISSPALGVDGTIYFGADAIDPSTHRSRWTHAAVPGDRPLAWSLAPGGGVAFDGVSAVDTASGAALWTLPASLGDPEADLGNDYAAIGDDGTVFRSVAATADRTAGARLVALDGRTGTVRWSFDSQRAGSGSSPAIDAEGTVYFAAVDSVFAVDGATGALVWAHAVGGQPTSSPAIGGDGTIYVRLENGVVYAIGP